jgi:hypothetical protein
MISQFLQHDKEAYVLSTTAFFILSWVSWRLWRFNIRPALHPQEPKEMPYWIPGTRNELFPSLFAYGLRPSLQLLVCSANARDERAWRLMKCLRPCSRLYQRQ